MVQCVLYNGPSSQKLPLPMGDLNFHLIRCSLGQTRVHNPNCRLQPFLQGLRQTVPILYKLDTRLSKSMQISSGALKTWTVKTQWPHFWPSRYNASICQFKLRYALLQSSFHDAIFASRKTRSSIFLVSVKRCYFVLDYSLIIYVKLTVCVSILCLST